MRVQAAPLHPADLAQMLWGADAALLQAGASGVPRLAGQLSPRRFATAAGRVGQAVAMGHEGAGLVVAAGASAAAQALLGRTVASMAGGTYSTLRCLPAADCLPLPSGMTAAQGAAAFINPLTALSMVEALRRDGRTALVHTAAGSMVGRMLQRLCSAEGIGLVNVVRNAEQAALLRSLGACHVCVLSSTEFDAELLNALAPPVRRWRSTPSAAGRWPAGSSTPSSGLSRCAWYRAPCRRGAMACTSRFFSTAGSTPHGSSWTAVSVPTGACPAG